MCMHIASKNAYNLGVYIVKRELVVYTITCLIIKLLWWLYIHVSGPGRGSCEHH